MAAPEKHGLAKQFTRLIILSGLASFLLLGFLQVVLNKGLRLYFDQPEVQTKASQYQVNELQNYITENSLSSTDIKKLTDWTRSHRYTATRSSSIRPTPPATTTRTTTRRPLS